MGSWQRLVLHSAGEAPAAPKPGDPGAAAKAGRCLHPMGALKLGVQGLVHKGCFVDTCRHACIHAYAHIYISIYLHAYTSIHQYFFYTYT